MGLRLQVDQRLELAQKLSLKLKIELKLALKLVIKLLQTLLLKQELTLDTVLDFRDEYQKLSWFDRRQFAATMARDAQIAHATRDMLFSLARFDHEEFGDLSMAALEIHDCARALHARGAQAVRGQQFFDREAGGPKLMALRLILRWPRQRDTDLLWSEEDLLKLLGSVLQYNSDGELVWVLAGGWAVELLLGECIRGHHDIDTVALDEHPMLLDTDKQHPDNYFDILSCTSGFIAKRCTRKVVWKGVNVFVLRPEFLFLSKFIRRPRPQDWIDVCALVRKFSLVWNIKLMREIATANRCGFKRMPELVNILETRDVEEILLRLSHFWGDTLQY